MMADLELLLTVWWSAQKAGWSGIIYVKSRLSWLTDSWGRSAIRSLKNDGATGQRKKLDDIFSRLDTIHERDRQTDARADGRRPADSKDRVYVYIQMMDIALRKKNW